jgi:raffinose/stachyose/melibiose transport system permease protein
VLVFLAPALLIYSIVMVFPLGATLYQSFFTEQGGRTVFVGLANYMTLFGDAVWSVAFWNALGNNIWFFAIHMLLQNPLGVLLAVLLSNPRLRFRGFYRASIFLPAILSFVIVAMVWKLILSPTWGIAPDLLDAIGLRHLFQPWLGKETYALTTLSLISVWQFLGLPMMLIYAALLSIPDEIIDAAECDGIVGWNQFAKIQMPLILPTIGIVSILTFVGTFQGFELVYVSQTAMAGPNFSTDLLGTFLFRTFFGVQLQPGNLSMGATLATVIFLIILICVVVYLAFVQSKLRRYQF